MSLRSLITFRSLFVAITALAVSAAAPRAEDLVGVARIIDGDTLEVDAVTIRLNGIDAPETDQVCLTAAGDRWNCGIEAKDHLAAKIADGQITCRPVGLDGYRRTLAVCNLGDVDLNAWLVAEGFALSFVRYSHIYDAQEADAKEHRRGMWAGAFIAPWDWRHRNRTTEILGALAVPIDAQDKLLPQKSIGEPPSPDCLIKGNVNRKGERIYHLPGSSTYAKIRMDRAQNRWFCSEAEAKAAGWRPAKGTHVGMPPASAKSHIMPAHSG